VKGDQAIRYAFHGGTTLYANLLNDIRAAKALGYDSIELWAPKVLRYLDAGFTVDDIASELGTLPVPMLDVIVGFERLHPADVEARLQECARLAEVAERIGCPTIQIVATEDFSDPGWPEQRRALIDSIRAMTAVTAAHGINLAIEPLVYSPFSSIPQALEVIDGVGSDSVGLCLDTWHLWTSGEDWDTVAALDPALILSAQLSDTLPRSGPQWRDSVRAALPGDGILPIREAVQAIEATGYRGHWCVEMLSDKHREWDQMELGASLLERLRAFVPPLQA
jgi:sugar phosphate isomerase/epimerase